MKVKGAAGPIDPYNDRLAIKLRDAPDTVNLMDVLTHPVGVFYVKAFLKAINRQLASELSVLDHIAMFRALQGDEASRHVSVVEMEMG